MLYSRSTRLDKSAKRKRTENKQVAEWIREMDPFVRDFFNQQLIPEASKRLKVTVDGFSPNLKDKFMNRLRGGVPKAVRHAIPSTGDCDVGEWGIRRDKANARRYLKKCVETTPEYKKQRAGTKRTF